MSSGLKTIFSKEGVPLTDFRASVVFSSLLNGVGECVFYIPTSSNKCRREFLEYGNFVLIRHESLPDWVGVIDTPRVWRNGYVEVHAFEAPYLLKFRTSGMNQVISGTAGARFKEMINIANSQGETLLRHGVISLDGSSHEETLTESIYTHIQRLANSYNKEWRTNAFVDSFGRLTVSIDFSLSVGVITNFELVQSRNISSGETLLEESGELVNSVEAVSDLSGTGSVASSYVIEKSYGIRHIRQAFTNITDASVLQGLAKDLVDKKSNPSIATPLVVTNSGDTFSNIMLGNVVKSNFYDAGFSENGLGFSEYLKIAGFRYSESVDTCELFTERVG